MNESKSHPITKRMVWEAFKKVRSNKGSAGMDRVSIQEFETDLKKNLYKLWNRLTSGSYFPPPVKEVVIPKSNGGERKLGIPTVADRVAQMVVKDYLEPSLEAHFDEHSYGYRPKKSAHDAIRACQKNCHRYAWVIDLDIKGFFDHMDHELLLKALTRHTQEKWVHMYVSRWLKAPVETKEGLQERGRGTPQGGVISPLLANLYLHYALDKWLSIHYPQVDFERYADDIVIHCRYRQEAEKLLKAIQGRLSDCGLQAHPEKTRIVYCKRSEREGDYCNVSFDFLGYTFKPRGTRGRDGRRFLGFNPGVSNKAVQRMNSEIKSMQGRLNCAKNIEVIAYLLNQKIRGWINYYGKFRKSDLQGLWELINNRLIQWVRKRYKSVKRRTKKAADWLRRIYRQNPFLFVHWYYTSP